MAGLLAMPYNGGKKMPSESARLTPVQYAALKALLSDQYWRLNNLYWIVNKDGSLVRFRLNWAQDELYRTHHTRNNILKVRQLGISTFIALLILDNSLFKRNHVSAIVDRTLPDASEKLSKIKFAFNHLDYLPENPTQQDIELAEIGALIKAEHTRSSGQKPYEPIGEANAKFLNGSKIRIGATVRGGTCHLLHVSELASIARSNPRRATEILTGTKETVGNKCLIFFESTHEGGRAGVNYEQIELAMSKIGQELTPLDSKFYFFPWWKHPDYKLEGYKPKPTAEQTKYFAGLEKELNITLTDAQKVWYIGKAADLKSFVRQEYPSTPAEALNPIMEGTIFASQLVTLAERGHLQAYFEPVAHRPIYTTWDLGVNDFMSIWWIQPNGQGKWLVLANYTANGLDIDHYIGVLREYDAKLGRCAKCVLPHDGNRHDIYMNTYDSALRKAGYQVTLVPVTKNKWMSIENTRELLRHCIIHARCSERTVVDGVRYLAGVDALKDYRLKPPGPGGSESREPLHDESSHASDSMRTFADAVFRGLIAAETGWGSPKDNPFARRRGGQSDYVKNMLN
jgi:hypothetical protein